MILSGHLVRVQRTQLLCRILCCQRVSDAVAQILDLVVEARRSRHVHRVGVFTHRGDTGQKVMIVLGASPSPENMTYFHVGMVLRDPHLGWLSFLQEDISVTLDPRPEH